MLSEKVVTHGGISSEVPCLTSVHKPLVQFQSSCRRDRRRGGGRREGGRGGEENGNKEEGRRGGRRNGQTSGGVLEGTRTMAHIITVSGLHYNRSLSPLPLKHRLLPAASLNCGPESSTHEPFPTVFTYSCLQPNTLFPLLSLPHMRRECRTFLVKIYFQLQIHVPTATKTFRTVFFLKYISSSQIVFASLLCL